MVGTRGSLHQNVAVFCQAGMGMSSGESAQGYLSTTGAETPAKRS